MFQNVNTMEKLKLIRGSKDREEEVEAMLLSWGAIDTEKFTYDHEEFYYFVNKDGRVGATFLSNVFLSYIDYKIVALPEKKEKHQFKPHDRVLVRDHIRNEWKCDIFSHYHNNSDGTTTYVCVGASWMQCIPFEGNERLAGTTNEPKGGEE